MRVDNRPLTGENEVKYREFSRSDIFFLSLSRGIPREMLFTSSPAVLFRVNERATHTYTHRVSLGRSPPVIPGRVTFRHHGNRSSRRVNSTAE